MVKDFNPKQIEFINSGKICVVGVNSPTTNFPHLTPTGVLYFNNKLYVGVKTDTAKYRFIGKGSNKLGMTVIDKSNFAYLSVIGNAILYDKDTIDDYELIFRLINENYIPKEAAIKRMNSILQEGNWVLIELTPTKIISLNQRGGFNGA